MAEKRSRSVLQVMCFQYSRKEGEMYGCTGVPCVKKIEKTKNDNEAIRHR